MKETIATVTSVEKAVAELEAAGEPVSVRRVRGRLTGGSFKTISEALRALEEKKRQAVQIAKERSDIPSSIHEAMETMKLEIWRAAQAETQPLIDAVERRRSNEEEAHRIERDSLLEDLQSQEEELKSAKEEIERSAAKASRLESELAALKRTLTETETRERTAREVVANLERREDERSRVITDLTAQIAILANTISHGKADRTEVSN